MDRKKKARLQSAGWGVSSPKDFLGLSEAESALIELKLDLSRLHREKREQAGLSQQALAKRLHSSQSRVAKMEAGDPSVSMDLILRSLLVLGTPAAILAQSLRGAAMAKAKRAFSDHLAGRRQTAL
jgi:plasmid maintenance system antidote protein VapI